VLYIPVQLGEFFPKFSGFADFGARDFINILGPILFNFLRLAKESAVRVIHLFSTAWGISRILSGGFYNPGGVQVKIILLGSWERGPFWESFENSGFHK